MPETGSARALRDQLDAAHAAAERLVREAEERVRATADSVPPRGWESPRSEEERQSMVPELQTLMGLLDLARDSVPPELARQLASALRELLLALRALLDWYLERLDRPPAAEREVTDIPID